MLTSILQKVVPINRGSARLIGLDTWRLRDLPKVKEPIDRTPFKGMDNTGFKTETDNGRYRIVLETVERTVDDSRYQLDVYDDKRVADPNIPGSMSTPPELLCRETYRDQEIAMRKFDAARNYPFHLKKE